MNAASDQVAEQVIEVTGRLVKGTVPIEGATDVLAAMAQSGPVGTRAINRW